jgi:hypothetical protein
MDFNTLEKPEQYDKKTVLMLIELANKCRVMTQIAEDHAYFKQIAIETTESCVAQI